MSSTAKIDWRLLTRMPEKGEYYRRDICFREGLRDASMVWGSGWSELLHRSTMLLLKPDALAAGVAPLVLDFLSRQEFSVVGAKAVSLDGQVWRALWRFQLTIASTDKLLLNDLLFREPGLILVLKDLGGGRVPAAVRLARLKGKSTPAAHVPNTLRALIAQPHRVLSFIHSPDEPADVLREIAVLTTGESRIRMLQNWREDGMSLADRDTLTRTLDIGATPRSFTFASALEHFEAALGGHKLDSELADEIEHALSSVRAGLKLDWQAFVSILARTGINFDPWAVVTFGAYSIELDDPGEQKQIGAPPFSDWEEG